MNFSTRILSEITNTILYSTNEKHLAKAINQLHILFANETGIAKNQFEHEDNIKSENGHIVAPVTAANCIKDIWRTTHFLRGIHKAIKDYSNNDNKKPVEILYAGCGPYATLLTPLTTQFSSEQIRFTMLEFNPTSLNAMSKLYAEWGIEEYIENIIQGDATSKDIPIWHSYDIIISETMQVVLQNECQVPITRNLTRFLKPKGTFIPQSIKVDVAWIIKELETRDQSKREFIDTIYELNYKKIPPPGHEKTIKLNDSRCEFLYYITSIKVFNNEIIEPYKCGLTMPLISDKFKNKPKAMTFKYVENQAPHFKKSYHF